MYTPPFRVANVGTNKSETKILAEIKKVVTAFIFQKGIKKPEPTGLGFFNWILYT